MRKRELNACKQDIYSFLHFSLPTNPEPYTDPDLYDPADDLRDLRLAVTLLMAACDFYRTITTKEKTNRPEHPQVSKFAYDALEKNYETLKRMFETEKLMTETLLRGSKAIEGTGTNE